MTPGKRNYLLLSLFDFLYLFAWSSTMAFFVIWTTQHLGISATKTGLLYSVNAFIALLMQPFFGFISDKFGLKKRLIWLLVALLLLGWAAAAWIVGKYIDSNPNLAFWLASLAIVIAAICFMLTKIELTDADVARSESLKVSHALELAKNGQFWMLLLFTLFVTQIYDTYDQQFAQYFSLQFPTPEEGNRWYGILASIQVCGETLFLCLMPWFVNRTGAKWALIIAGLIMSVRIVGSAVPLGPVWIGAVKMMHALEKPLILVSVFKFIAANFDHKLSSTVYLLVLFVASIATAIYSPLAGYLYDTIGFADTYLILGGIAGLFTLISVFTLQDKREPKKPGAAPSGAVTPAQ